MLVWIVTDTSLAVIGDPQNVSSAVVEGAP